MTDLKKRQKNLCVFRYSFNLVEIVLAMAVLAIGISSVLVLFPVGVNANRDAVAGNNMADLSETILAAVRNNVDVIWNNWEKGKSVEYVKVDGQQFVKTGGEPETAKTEADASSSDLDSDKTMIMLGNGVILFRQISKIKQQGDKNAVVISEFSAIARVWEDENALNDVLFATRNGFESSGSGQLDNMSRVIRIEISWPANLAYESREKAYFCYESFNNRYEPFFP